MRGIFLGIGSNLGNREKNLIRCIEALYNQKINVIQASSVYESSPYGFKTQPDFYNMVVRVKTDLSPNQLLTEVKSVEKEIGRKKTFHWGPRIIDVDILAYNELIIRQPELRIPHQQLHLRRFVLIPLEEVESDFIHPETKKSIDQMLAECKDKNNVRIMKNIHYVLKLKNE